jgi:hypothetical protein
MRNRIVMRMVQWAVAAAVFLIARPVALAQVPPATGVTIAANLPSPQLVGTPVAFTAAGIGSVNYQYQFWYQAPGAADFTLAQDFSPLATWTAPSTLAPGDYLVVVHVRTGTAGFDAQAWTFFTLQAPPATGVTLTASAASPQPAGAPVVFTASGIGSVGYQYQFWYQAPGSTAFTLAQDFSPAATWTMPATLTPGDYLVVVHVRTGSVGFDAQAWMPFTLVVAPATGVTLSVNFPSPQAQGVPVAFTGSGTGSSGYQYQFWIRNVSSPSALFGLVQDWNTVPTWQVPPALTAGTYTVVVHVRTGAGPGFDAQAFMDYTIGPALPAPTIASLSPASGSAAGGTTVTITGANFQPGVSVLFGAFPQSIVSVTPTAITLVTTPGIIGGCIRACTGLVNVVVTNPDQKTATKLGGYAYF